MLLWTDIAVYSCPKEVGYLSCELESVVRCQGPKVQKNGVKGLMGREAR
jgi:hypothetical protein